MSVAVERQLPKESHELERDEESDTAESVGDFNGSVRSTSLPLAIRRSSCCHSTTWRRLSSSSARTEALRLCGQVLTIGSPVMRLASSARSEGSRGNSLPCMALTTSLNETERLWEDDGFLTDFGREEGGCMNVYWKGSWSRLGGSDRDWEGMSGCRCEDRARTVVARWSRARSWSASCSRFSSARHLSTWRRDFSSSQSFSQAVRR